MALNKLTKLEKEMLNSMNPAAMDTKLGDRISELENEFQSTEQTGNGGAQAIAHGLGVEPRIVIIFFSSIPADGATYTYTKGTANVNVTATTGAKYFVYAKA